MNNEKFYRGQFDHVGDRKLNSVRVFVSSTFSDTTDERNGLISHVYPQLRQYCLTKYNVQFQYSDMRWGIQSTASNSYATVDMCLQELDSCSRLSMATNCVILLSHRYGSRLVPVHIPSRIFELFQESLSMDTEEKKFLSQMYRLDENYIEKRYFLKSMDEIKEWASTESKLQLILRKAANNCYQQGKINEDERNEFYISVTAQEIYRAFKNNRNKPRRIVCFIREIDDIDKLDAKFRETENADETNVLLDTIKQLLYKSLDPSDVYTYHVRWNDENDRKQYLSKFFDDFHNAMKSQIDFHMNIAENQQKNLLYNQVLEHAIQCNLLTQRYFPRLDIMSEIKKYILSTSNRPCVLFGESGTGKSSIMAKLVSEIPTWSSESKSLSILIRFLGATPSSSDIRRPLISIIEQICTIYHMDKPLNIENVKETLESILMRIPRTEQLVILLDSIDQLQISDLENLSTWLPTKFPSKNVKYILSTIPEIEIDRVEINIREQLKTIYNNDMIEIEINEFNENLAENVLDYWLEQDQRCLTPTQRELLKQKFSSNRFLTPLFVSLLYDQSISWHSYDETPDREFQVIQRTSDAIEYLYKQLGVKHGQVLFRRAMRYIQLSGGLSELEIEDILSSDDEVLQAVFVHYLPPFDLFRLPSTLWIRIRNDMHKYLVEKDIDNIPCIYFYHRSFQYYKSMNFQQMRIDNEEKEVLEKYRLFYFADQYKTTFNMSYSPKLMNKYKLSTDIIPVNRCLTEQKPFKAKKKRQYNLRRIHQLYINLNRYDFVHEWTVFDYEFLLAYILCGEYKMSDLLYEFSIGAHDPNGELRLLLKQYEASSVILDKYPNNFPFELIYRLLPFVNELPSFAYNLLEQCLTHCPLYLITDEQRHPSLAKYSLLNIISMEIDSFRVYVLTGNEKLYIFSFNYYCLMMIRNLEIKYKKTEPNEKLISLVCKYPYVCCLSSNSSMVLVNLDTKDVSVPTSCKKLVSFINNEVILIISSSNDGLELWDCSKSICISKYKFNDNTIEDCIFNKSIIKVVLKENTIISYLKLDNDLQFNPIRSIYETINNHTHHLFIDNHSEFYYSYNKSVASLIIYDDENSNTKQIINNIDFNSPPTSVIHLPKSNSIAWLTSTSLMIFQPLHKKNYFQPFRITSLTNPTEYDLVHDHSSIPEFEDRSAILACLNKPKKIIDVYEWQYDDDKQQHVYRQFNHFQLDISIDQFVFTAYWYDGVVIYCSDGNTLYKYNATMFTFLTSSKSSVSSPIIDETPSLHSGGFLTTKDNDNSLKIFTLHNNHILDLKFSIDSIINYYITTSSSHILCVDENSILSIYNLNSSKLLWTSKSFENNKLQIHSNQSSFILICLTTKEIFYIDIQSLNLNKLFDVPVDCHLSTMTSNNQLYIISNDQKTLIQFDIYNQTMTILPSIQIKSSKFLQFYSIMDHLILHNNNNQIYLWWKENKRLTELEPAINLAINSHRLVLVCTDNQTLILYDLEEKLRGIIRLEDGAGQCEAICLSDYSKEYDQYLFLICQDRLLRMFNVSNGKQLAKLFIHIDLFPFVGILNNRVLLKIANKLCIIKILDKKSLPNKSSDIKCPLLGETMWMTCHHDNSIWQNTVSP